MTADPVKLLEDGRFEAITLEEADNLYGKDAKDDECTVDV